MKALEDWLMKDQRRTAVICRAKFEGEMKWCCILHLFARWDLPPKEFPGDVNMTTHPQPVESIFYADSLDAAIQGAMKQ